MLYTFTVLVLVFFFPGSSQTQAFDRARMFVMNRLNTWTHGDEPLSSEALVVQWRSSKSERHNKCFSTVCFSSGWWTQWCWEMTPDQVVFLRLADLHQPYFLYIHHLLRAKKRSRLCYRKVCTSLKLRVDCCETACCVCCVVEPVSILFGTCQGCVRWIHGVNWSEACSTTYHIKIAGTSHKVQLMNTSNYCRCLSLQ